MPPNMSNLGAEMLAVLLNHATAADPRLQVREHVITTFDSSSSAREQLTCVLAELVNRAFEVPFEGSAVHRVKMIEEAYLNDHRLRYVVGAEYATYLLSVTTPAPIDLFSRGDPVGTPAISKPVAPPCAGLDDRDCYEDGDESLGV
jgi:hypothetical protein